MARKASAAASDEDAAHRLRGGSVAGVARCRKRAERPRDFNEFGGTCHGPFEGAVKTNVHRLRQRCRERLRAEVARTVARAEDIDEELRHLIEVFSE